MALIRIEIITSIERNKALSLINELIRGAEGWVADHKLFSNISATLSFEIPFNQTSTFIDSLFEKGFQPDVKDIPKTQKEEDIKGIIAISFIHNEPDLKRDVPAFEG